MKLEEKIKHEGLHFDPKTLEWSGEIPKGTRTVHIQILDDDDVWKPKLSVSVPRKRTEAIELLEKTVRKGPCSKRLYRIIPATIESENVTHEQEDSNMATNAKTSRKATATSKTASKKTSEGFREGSFRDLAVKALQKGKVLSAEELVKQVNGKLAGRSARVFIGPVIKDLQKAGLSIQISAAGYKLGIVRGEAKSKPKATESVKVQKVNVSKPAKKKASTAEKEQQPEESENIQL